MLKKKSYIKYGESIGIDEKTLLENKRLVSRLFLKKYPKNIVVYKIAFGILHYLILGLICVF